MAAGKLNLYVEQGATFSKTLTWYNYDGDNPPTYAGTAKDLSGYTASMKIRDEYADASPVIALTHLSGLTLGGVAGTIIITLTAAQTALFTFDEAYYDLNLTKDGVTTRLVQGIVKLSKTASA